MKVTARAHTNIALVKYWGKSDPQLIIPQTSSLSLTLDKFFTDTSVEFKESLDSDQFFLNGQEFQGKGLSKISHFMDIVRQLAGIKEFATIKSTNHVPTSAGLASSASAFAALATAASNAAGLKLSRKDLSRLARRGSGSATRSIYGGLVEWQRGTDDASSFAVPIEEHPDFGIEMIAVLINKGVKKVSSRSGMQLTVDTSPFYPEWRTIVAHDLKAIKKAIQNRDIDQIGHIAQENALRMHALTLSADPGFSYFTSETLHTMRLVNELHNDGVKCYYTMDAGPNVKIIYDPHERNKILQKLEPIFGRERLVIAQPGPGVQLL